MTSDLERAVVRHYGGTGLVARIFDALRTAGKDLDHLTVDDLAPVDEFHIGGRAATMHVVAKMGLRPEMHVLDVGCGIGGASRYIASTTGARVTGIDLTPEYVAAARALAESTGLNDRVAYETASALSMPFADRAFDAAITLHVAMNIGDRPGLYAEIARVLKPGASFAVYDVMQGDGAGLRFPLPWSSTPETSHLETPAAMRRLLADTGFDVHSVEDRTAYGINFFRERFAATAAAGGAPPVGLQLLMGPETRLKFENVLAALEASAVAPVIMMARRT